MRALEIDHLTKTYGSRKALNELTFTVPGGQIFGFVGSNGAGKTTAMRIMLGVLAPDSGQVRWDGQPLTLQARRHFGYMPEERGLYPKMKVGAQLTYLAQLHGMSKSDAQASAERWAERLNVHERLGDAVDELSLGNQQRVQLAAALVHNPDVLVLDEPFSGLDPVAVDAMSSVLRERAAEGVPVLFSSHQLDLVQRLCDQVGIIREGTLVARGTVDELRATDQPVWQITVARGVELHSLADVVPGAQVETDVRANSATARVTLPSAEPGAEQPLLAEAMRLGPVTEFTTVRPDLADLFRGVVSSEPEANDSKKGAAA